MCSGLIVLQLNLIYKQSAQYREIGAFLFTLLQEKSITRKVANFI